MQTTQFGQTQSLLSNATYRADSQMTQGTYGNGLIDSRVYDTQGRLTEQQLMQPTVIFLINETISMMPIEIQGSESNRLVSFEIE